MYRVNARKVKREPYIEVGARNVRMKRYIGGEDGARTNSLHEIVVRRGGYTAPHDHDWEHALYVLEGRGEILHDAGALQVKAGDAVLIRPGEHHQFVQKGAKPLRLLCVTPL